MKTKLLFIYLFLLASFGFSQTNYTINWQTGISQEDASLAIETGDKVIWNFTDGAPHSVTSQNGSQEEFDSTILAAGSSYEYTFTEEGENPYLCNVHNSMTGVITVASLSTDQQNFNQFKISPNPVKEMMLVSLPEQMKSAELRIYDISGKLVLEKSLNQISSYISVNDLAASVYLLRLSNQRMVITRKFVKQ